MCSVVELNSRACYATAYTVIFKGLSFIYEKLWLFSLFEETNKINIL